MWITVFICIYFILALELLLTFLISWAANTKFFSVYPRMFLFHFHFWKIVLLGKKFIFSCCCQDFIFQHFYYDVSGCEFFCYYPNWNFFLASWIYNLQFSSVGNFSTFIPSHVISVSFPSPHYISITYMFMCLSVPHFSEALFNFPPSIFSVFFHCLISILIYL